MPIVTQSSSGADALMAMTLSPSRSRIATNPSPSKTRPSSRGVETNAGVGSSPSKRVLTPSPTQHAHPAPHLWRISSADAPSPSSPSLSPSSSRFTAQEDDKEVDVPTVRVHNPSTRDSYTAPVDEAEKQQHEETPTLRPPTRPIRIRPSSRVRPRSYHDILEDFEVHARGESVASSVAASSLGAVAEERVSRLDDRGHYEEMREGEVQDEPQARPRERDPTRRYPRERKEDTARKKKRFSLPAVGVQTVPVVARSAPTQGGWGGVGRRLSLVLGARPIGGRGRNGNSERERDGSAHSPHRNDQSVSTSSQDKVPKGGESSAARMLMDVLRSRRGKEKA
jgi:hypothetical protein